VGVQRRQQPPRDGGDFFDGTVERLGIGLRRLLKPESLRTNCSAEALISSSVAGGSKLTAS